MRSVVFITAVAFGQDLFLAPRDPDPDPYMYAAEEWFTGPGPVRRAVDISVGPKNMPRPKPALGFQPNFIFILTDDQDNTLGRDGYSAEGSLEIMPKLREHLAGEGASFSHFYVNTPICCPSRTEFFSGRYYHNVGPPTIQNGTCMNVDTSFATRNNTGMFGLLKSAGYNVGVFGKVTNDQHRNFQEMVEFKSASFIDSPWDYNSFTSHFFYQYDESSGGAPSIETLSGDAGEKYQTSQIGNRTLSWLDRAIQEDAPFFAYVGPHAPHAPATPAPWYATAFDDVELPITPNYNWTDEDGGGKADHVQKTPPLSDRAACWERRHFQDRWASLLSVDDLVEGVYSKIEAAGLLDRTYIVYTSDHGFKLGQWRIGSSKQHPYETDIRIPFIIRGPGIEKGSQLAQVSANVDLLPTMLELAAGRAYADAAGVDGRSMVPFLVPSAATEQGTEWRHYLLNEFKSIGDLGMNFVGETAWENGKETTRSCGGSTPLAPEDARVRTMSNCLERDGMSNGKCYLIDNSASNNWRQLRVVNATHNWNYVEYDPEFTFQTSNLQHYELYDLEADVYQMKNIYNSMGVEVQRWLHETVDAYFRCSGAECP